MANIIRFLAIFLAVLSGSAMGAEIADCNDVYFNFFFCQAYIEEDYYHVPADCCTGLRHLNAIAKLEKIAPRLICQCIENNAGVDHPPFSEERIENLYTLCHIHLSFPISERMNCSKV